MSAQQSRTILLVRHGETIPTPDMPNDDRLLTEQGGETMRRVGSQIQQYARAAGFSDLSVVVSPRLRTIMSAKAAFPDSPHMYSDKRLSDMYIPNGVVPRLATAAALLTVAPVLGAGTKAPLGGESFDDAARRTLAALDDAAHKTPDDALLVAVGHSGNSVAVRNYLTRPGYKRAAEAATGLGGVVVAQLIRDIRALPYGDILPLTLEPKGFAVDSASPFAPEHSTLMPRLATMASTLGTIVSRGTAVLSA